MTFESDLTRNLKLRAHNDYFLACVGEDEDVDDKKMLLMMMYLTTKEQSPSRKRS